jgi:NADPH-dependent ferric siderophore reductase
VLNGLLERFFVKADVDSVETAGRFRKIVLRSAELAEAPWKPGQQVRIVVSGAVGWGMTLRTYSVWHRHGDLTELYALDHGEGPGSSWAAAATPGDAVLLTKPNGDFVVRDDAPYHVFAGEETASVAFGAMLRALPVGASTYATIEVPDAADQLPLDRPVTWVHRGDRSAASSEALVKAVAALDLPEEPGIAYVAGEARTLQAVRAHLVRERGWPRRFVLTKPFWTPGKRGME